MKTQSQYVMVACLAASIWLIPISSLRAADAKPGDTLEDVKHKMGNPKGQFRVGDGLFLVYDRGTVELYEGHVVKTDFVSRNELEAKQKAERTAATARQKGEEARRKQLIKEGEAELARILADESFPEKTGAEQVAYWEAFMATYPDVIVADHLTAAREKRDEERAAEEAEREEARLKKLAEEEQPRLSSRKMRKERRRMEPGEPVVTPAHTPDYRPMGAPRPDDWPY